MRRDDPKGWRARDRVAIVVAMDAQLWHPLGTDQLRCETHDETFDKGATCAGCMQGFARDSADAVVQRLEAEILACDRQLRADEDALRTEARAAVKLRQLCIGKGKDARALKSSKANVAAQQSKVVVTALREAIAETRRRREDLEAALFRALDRQAVERGGAKH